MIATPQEIEVMSAVDVAWRLNACVVVIVEFRTRAVTVLVMLLVPEAAPTAMPAPPVPEVATASPIPPAFE